MNQWRKRGSCADLAATTYYEPLNSAFNNIVPPDVFRYLKELVTFEAKIGKAFFSKANPNLQDELVRMICKNGYVKEIRTRLNKDLYLWTCVPFSRPDCLNTITLHDIPSSWPLWVSYIKHARWMRFAPTIMSIIKVTLRNIF